VSKQSRNFSRGDRAWTEAFWYDHANGSKKKTSVIPVTVVDVGETDERGFCKEVGCFQNNPDGSPYRGIVIRFVGTLNGAHCWGYRKPDELIPIKESDANIIDQTRNTAGQLSLPMVLG
jgi:hypothetical protein